MLEQENPHEISEAELDAAALALVRNPYSAQRLPPATEKRLYETFGIEPRIIIPIQGKQTIYPIPYEGPAPDWDKLPGLLWMARPAQPSEVTNQSGYMYTRPTQGRSCSVPISPTRIEGKSGTYRYADIKGNGWGGTTRAGKSQELRTPASATYDIEHIESRPFLPGTTKVYGLLDSTEATNDVEKKELVGQGMRNEEIVALVSPQIPSNGDKELDFSPVFIARMWRDPATLADMLFPVDAGPDIHLQWFRFVANPNHTEEKGFFSIFGDLRRGIEAADIRTKIDQIRRASVPYIRALSEDYAVEFGKTPTEADLFQYFLSNHLNNYRELMKGDLVHGALHAQNIRVGGEWGDLVTVTNTPKLKDEKVRRERLRDFWDCYIAMTMMSVVLNQHDLINPGEFYAQAIEGVGERNQDSFPPRFGNFVMQDNYRDDVRDRDPQATIDKARLDLKDAKEYLENYFESNIIEFCDIIGVQYHRAPPNDYAFKWTTRMKEADKIARPPRPPSATVPKMASPDDFE